jgi:hypothetical protein
VGWGLIVCVVGFGLLLLSGTMAVAGVFQSGSDPIGKFEE